MDLFRNKGKNIETWFKNNILYVQIILFDGRIPALTSGACFIFDLLRSLFYSSAAALRTILVPSVLVFVALRLNHHFRYQRAQAVIYEVGYI